MRKAMYDKLPPDVRETVRAAANETQREYYREHKKQMLASQAKFRKNNPLNYARTMAKHWNKKVAELEAQQKEDTPNV